MPSYALTLSDIYKKTLAAKLKGGHITTSTATNQKLPIGVDVNDPTLIAQTAAIAITEEYQQLNLNSANFQNLTIADATYIAQTLADPALKITTVWIKGRCFAEFAGILALIANLPASVTQFICSDGAFNLGLNAQAIQDFTRLLANTKIASLNLNNNMLTDPLAKILCDHILDPINQIFLLGNKLSLSFQSDYYEKLLARGISIGFGGELLSAPGNIAKLSNFDSASYREARILAIALVKSNLVLQQQLLTDVEQAIKEIIATGSTAFSHHPAIIQILDCEVLPKLKALFAIPKPPVNVSLIHNATLQLPVDPIIVTAAQVAVLVVLTTQKPYTLAVLQQNMAELAEHARVYQARVVAIKLQRRADHIALHTPPPPVPLPYPMSVVYQQLIEEAIATRRRLLQRLGRTADVIEQQLSGHRSTCESWVRKGTPNEIKKYTDLDKARLAAP